MMLPWDRARQARAREHQAALDALERVSVAQAKAFEALAQTFGEYFKSFQVSGEGRSWAHTDLTEAARERDAWLKQPDPMPDALAGLAHEHQRLNFILNELDG